MALPVPESAAGPRADIIRLLGKTPEGLSDGELAAALADRHPNLNSKAVNHQCRKLEAEGAVERVGTRPVRTRVVVMAGGSEAPAPEAPATEDAATEDAATEDAATEDPSASVGTAAEPSPSDTDPAPLPVASGLSRVQEDIVRALADAPGGLTDNGLAEALAGRYPDVDPKAFNYQCRKLAKAGLVERTARSRDASIRTRLTARGAEVHTTQPDQAPDLADVPLVNGHAPSRNGSAPAQNGTSPAENGSTEPEPEPEPVRARTRRPRQRAKTPSDDVARIRRSERDGDDPDEPLLRFLPFAPAATARTALRERMAERAALRRVPERSNEVVVPTRDVLQGWSRTQNVAAAVAHWLTRHGGTIRAANATGPAHDLVATLHGDDVHVEVTGWPPDGARSHPTTLAGDWFRAAARAAAQRRRANPRARVVIALPDTRRYRALADDDADVLRRARAEVWFVDSSGDVQRT
jgi:DNA-binding MarR family transcriptional regulator